MEMLKIKVEFKDGRTKQYTCDVNTFYDFMLDELEKNDEVTHYIVD